MAITDPQVARVARLEHLLMRRLNPSFEGTPVIVRRPPPPVVFYDHYDPAVFERRYAARIFGRGESTVTPVFKSEDELLDYLTVVIRMSWATDTD